MTDRDYRAVFRDVESLRETVGTQSAKITELENELAALKSAHSTSTSSALLSSNLEEANIKLWQLLNLI